MRKKVIAMVMVGGRGTRLKEITKYTAKPAVAFGGKYRLIDFVLSNISNSKIDTVGLITQYEPHDLMQYIGHGSTWDLDVNDGGISFLTPYTSSRGEAWQKGTAHAIKQHFRFIEQYQPEYVLILGGDHIYKMNYQEMIRQHIETNADITIGAFHIDKNQSRFGILEIDDAGKVHSFIEKPTNSTRKTASMGVYVFNTKVLRHLLEYEAEKLYDFGKDIIPKSLEYKLNVYAYRFKGYFKDVGTVESLYEANMDLIDNPQYLKLHEYTDFPIYTKSSNLPPHHIYKKGIIQHSLISDGCMIGGNVIKSILSSRVVILEGATVSKSLLYEGVHIGKNVQLENAIVLEHTTIKDDLILKFSKPTILDQAILRKIGEKNG